MNRAALLHRLADGRTRSGEALARELGITRAAVWKHVNALERWGLDVLAVPGRGYRLARPLELLDPGCLAERLGRGGRVRLDVFTELDSTNAYLLDRPPRPGELAVCLAEYQSAGRGRRGRRWVAPLGSGLCLSAAWQFAETPPELSALTLAAGVAVHRVLAETARVEAALKWPNDLVLDGRKLGGLLVELRAEAQGGCYVVIGLGLNVDVAAERLAGIGDWPGGAVDLAEAAGDARPSRLELAAALVEALGALLESYQTVGFAPYRAAWSAADHLRGKRVVLEAATGRIEGVACGIDPDGALRVDSGGGAVHRVVSGDVTVRPA